jgi:uncharacterized membrane protein
MSTTTQPLAVRVVPAGVAALAAYELAFGLWMLVAPRSFYDAVGPFGAYNSHYVLDTSAWQLAFGVALAVAVRRASWRVPLLAFAVVQFALHAINHVVDAGEADPSWVGVFDAVSLSLATVALAVLLTAARHHEEAGTARRAVVGP